MTCLSRLNIAFCLVVAAFTAGCGGPSAPDPRFEIAKSRDKIDRVLLDKTTQLLGKSASSTAIELRVSQQSEPISVLASTTPLKLAGNSPIALGDWLTLTENSKAITVALSADPRSLDEIGDNLEITTQSTRQSPSCEIAAEGSIDGRRPGEAAKPPYRRAFFSGDVPVDVIETFAVPDRDVKSRELMYVLRRTLGLAGDELWRTTQTGATQFYFRRTDRDLKYASGLVVTTGAAVAPSNVALRLTGGTRGEQLLELNTPIASESTTAAASYQYEFGHLLQDAARGLLDANGNVLASVVISEIVVQFQENKSIPAEKSGLRAVSVVAKRNLVSGYPVTAETRDAADGNRTRSINLKTIIPAGSSDVKLTTLNLTVLPPRKGTCSALLRSVSVVDRYEGRAPWHAVQNVNATLNRNAFSPEMQRAFDGRTLPALDFLAHVGFKAPIVEPNATRPLGAAACAAAAAPNDLRPDETPTAQIAYLAGASLRACSGFLYEAVKQVTRVRQGELQVNLPLLRSVRTSEALAIRISGDAKLSTPGLKFIVNTLNRTGVTIASRPTTLNTVLALPNSPDIAAVQVVASLGGALFDVGINEIAVFSPTQIALDQSFAHPQPAERVSQFQLTAATATTATLTTDAPLAALESISVTVDVDADAVPRERCWLRVTPVWGKQSGEPMQFCDELPGVPVIISAGQFQKLANSITAPLSALEISVVQDGINSSRATARIRADAVATGTAWLSAQDRYLQLPLLKSSEMHATLRPEITGVAAIQRGLTTVTMPNPGADFAATNRWLRQLEESKGTLNVRSMALLKTAQTSDDAWLGLVRPVVTKRSNTRFVLAFFAFCAVLGFALWRYRKHRRMVGLKLRLASFATRLRTLVVAHLPNALDAVAWLAITTAVASAAIQSSAAPASSVIVLLGALVASWFMLPKYINVSLPVVIAAAAVFCAWAIVLAATQPIMSSIGAVAVVLALTWTSARAVLGTGSNLPISLWHIGWPAAAAGLFVLSGITSSDLLHKGNQYSWASIFITVSMARALHLAWPWLQERIAFLRGREYLQDRGGKYGMVAIAALVITAGLTAVSARGPAEYTASCAYFGLWGLLLHRAFAYWRDRKQAEFTTGSSAPAVGGQ